MGARQGKMRQEIKKEEMEMAAESTPLVSLNHVSFVCRSVSESVAFYKEVLGFASIKRPSSFNFHGAWLFNYRIGIHLLQCGSEEAMPQRKKRINPKDNHISFQCSDMPALKRKLERKGIEYVSAVVQEDGVQVQQLFFHDPDGHMIEICNCEDLPVLPLASSSQLKRPPPPPPAVATSTVVDSSPATNPLQLPDSAGGADDECAKASRCGAKVDAIIDDLHAAMLSISF